MKNKKFSVAVVIVVLGMALSSLASMKDVVTLLLVPREDGPVRVGMDIANKYPTLLISYVVRPNGTVSMHGWTGKEWVNVTADAYKGGEFFQKGPSSAIIVEPVGQSTPESLIPPVNWCPSVYAISTIDTRALLHLMGRHYDFNYKEWKWFSSHYHMPLESINPDSLNVAWYHRRLNENLTKPTIVGSSDLQYWMVLRSTEQMGMGLEAEVLALESGETGSSEMEAPAEMLENPLTNAIPDAVVLGPGDADEEIVAPAVTNDVKQSEMPPVEE